MENQKPIDVLLNEHIFPVGDLNAITAGEWNEIADVLAQNAILAIRLGTDWKETDLFCKGIKQ